MNKICKIDLSKELCNTQVWSKIIKRYLHKGKRLGTLTEPDKILETLADYQWDYPTRILIPKDNGKMREIFKFNNKDSFLLKAVNEIFYKKFNHLISSSVYSYRENCRVEDGARYVQNVFRRGNYYGVKLDISNYFMSVSKQHIQSIIDDLVSDNIGKSLLQKLFNLNAFYDGYDTNTATEEYLGLVPGSALSSFLANYALYGIDKYLQNESKGYVRYSDDLIFFSETKERSEEILKSVTAMLNSIGLDINPSKIETFGYTKEVVFLGLNVTPTGIGLPSKTSDKIKRFIKLEINKFRLEQRNKETLTKLIYNINRKLYNVYMDNAKYLGLVEFYFLNTTSVKEFMEIDFYLKDRLRQFYTKANNKSNIKKCPNELLKECGYIPMLFLRDMRLENVDLYRTYVFRHLNRYSQKEPNTPKLRSVTFMNVTDMGIKSYTSHYEFLSRILNNPIGYIPYVVDEDEKTLTPVEEVKDILNSNSFNIYVNCIFDKSKDFKLKVNIDFESAKDTEKLIEKAVTHFNSLTLSEYDYMSFTNIDSTVKDYRFFKPSFFNPFINIKQYGLELNIRKRFKLFESCMNLLIKTEPSLIKNWRDIQYISLQNITRELPSVVIFLDRI